MLCATAASTSVTRRWGGGEIDDITFGLNWYPNAYVRLMANYVNVLQVDGGAHDGDNPDRSEHRWLTELDP